MSVFWRGLWAGLIVFAFVQPAMAGNSSRDPAREARYEKQLTEINGSQVDTFRAANDALDKNQYSEAAKLYEQVIQAAPSFDAAVRRLAYCRLQLGSRAEAIRIAEHAVSLRRTEENLSALAMMIGSGTTDRGAKLRALELLKEARALPGGDDDHNIGLTAQFALDVDDMTLFHQSAEQLRTRFPNTLETHYYSGVEAIVDEHWIRAEREILAARDLGLPADVAQQILDSGVHHRALGWKLAAWISGTVAIWALGLALLFLVGFGLSALTIRSVESTDPNVALSNSERRLRKVYSAVVNAAGLYYYFSLPIVLIIVLGVCAGVIFAILAAGFIMIKLMVILGIGAILTIGAMIKSLFLKPSNVQPGRPLRREEAPGLWALAENVARDMNTRPVDEIRITEGADLAVYERGSWREKMRDKGQRVLLLGVGILEGFKQDAFRSVLAHEYGHFSHRDTAGGDIALRVRNDMTKFYLAMYSAGQATWLNAAFHFLRAYNFIFRRISHGATRLQEVLADRVAAQTYGAFAFEGGLMHVIRRRLEFEHVANSEIDTVIKSREPLRSIYEPPAVKLDPVEKQLQEIVSRPTTDDDTHPSPKDRIRLIAAVKTEPRISNEGEVWELFADRDAIKREMIQQVEKHIAPHRK